ncbi:Hypothetical protein NocV09_04200270 [Nannochloropsis oceanica]
MAPQMLGNFFTPKKAPLPESSTPTPIKAGKANAGRLNLKSIPKEAPPTPKKRTFTSAGVKLPAFSFGAKKPAASAEPTARVVNGKLQGYFTNEQIESLEVARREVPSSAPSYWKKIAARVPGQTPETCKAMVNQILLDKARGTGKQFFGGYVEVKETKMVVDTEATVGKRFKAAFGIK